VKVETSSLSKNKQVKYILTPNHKISFDRNNQAKIEYIDADSYSAWRNGNGLKFVNEKLSVIIPRLKKWYGVNNIICDNEVGNNYRFSFSIDSETLGEVMNILDRISPLNVKKERNIYVIER
jgi:transmembrane sensor